MKNLGLISNSKFQKVIEPWPPSRLYFALDIVKKDKQKNTYILLQILRILERHGLMAFNIKFYFECTLPE